MNTEPDRIRRLRRFHRLGISERRRFLEELRLARDLAPCLAVGYLGLVTSDRHGYRLSAIGHLPLTTGSIDHDY